MVCVCVAARVLVFVAGAAVETVLWLAVQAVKIGVPRLVVRVATLTSHPVLLAQ